MFGRDESRTRLIDAAQTGGHHSLNTIHTLLSEYCDIRWVKDGLVPKRLYFTREMPRKKLASFRKSVYRAMKQAIMSNNIDVIDLLLRVGVMDVDSQEFGDSPRALSLALAIKYGNFSTSQFLAQHANDRARLYYNTDNPTLPDAATQSILIQKVLPEEATQKATILRNTPSPFWSTTKPWTLPRPQLVDKPFVPLRSELSINLPKTVAHQHFLYDAYHGNLKGVENYLSDCKTSYDLNVTTFNGDTALMLAAAHGHSEIVFALLQYRASAKMKLPHPTLNVGQQNVLGLTALSLAILCSNLSLPNLGQHEITFAHLLVDPRTTIENMNDAYNLYWRYSEVVKPFSVSQNFSSIFTPFLLPRGVTSVNGYSVNQAENSLERVRKMIKNYEQHGMWPCAIDHKVTTRLQEQDNSITSSCHDSVVSPPATASAPLTVILREEFPNPTAQMMLDELGYTGPIPGSLENALDPDTIINDPIEVDSGHAYNRHNLEMFLKFQIENNKPLLNPITQLPLLKDNISKKPLQPNDIVQNGQLDTRSIYPTSINLKKAISEFIEGIRQTKSATHASEAKNNDKGKERDAEAEAIEAIKSMINNFNIRKTCKMRKKTKLKLKEALLYSPSMPSDHTNHASSSSSSSTSTSYATNASFWQPRAAEINDSEPSNSISPVKK